ncbi:MAG: flagellar FliJ family protein [Myxococcota bacterium]
MNDRKRLERILRVRERLQEVRRAELIKAQRRTLDAEREVSRLIKSEQEILDQLAESAAKPAKELQSLSEVVRRTSTGRRHAEDRRNIAKQEEEERSKSMARAMRDVKVLECFRERLRETERQTLRKIEQAQSDEAATRSTSLMRSSGLQRGDS